MAHHHKAVLVAGCHDQSRQRVCRAAAVTTLLLSLAFVVWVFPGGGIQQPLHVWRLRLATGSPSVASTTSCGSSGAATAPAGGATGATGTLFSGAKQRTYSGPRLMSGPAAAKPSASPTAAAAAARNWAVVTTINPPTDAILGVAALPGWSVVVVGDTSSPPFNASSPNMVFLSAEDQKQLAAPYAAFTSLLPWRHFGRKNVGFLYAVLHGAQAVWDFDDDNALKPGLAPRLPATEVYHVGLHEPSSCAAFNPYPNMGGPSAVDPAIPPSWPRGFPLDLIRQPCPHQLVPGNTSRVAVLQSLADHDPDVDAIYRLTRGVPFSFKPSSRKTLVLPQGSLTPWNAQATLVLKPALWALLLPVTVHGRVSDIWRSYVAQRLLWDVGYSVAFAPPMVIQNRGPHNYLADMQAEADLYAKSTQLVQFLRSWRGAAPSIAGRYEELMIEMFERGYIQEQDVKLAQQWLKALVAGGYEFPELVQPTG